MMNILPYNNSHDYHKLLKIICGFLNGDGGVIYIKNNDNQCIEDTIEYFSTILKDNILPNITNLIFIEPIPIDQRYLIKCEIICGDNKPYFIYKAGSMVGGVYKRVGLSNQILNEYHIKELIRSSGKSYEESRSFIQELTFQSMEEEFKKRKIEFNIQKMQTMKMIGNDGLYTNLALLLSDQCPFSTKLAIFQEHDNSTIKDRYEFTGSLFKQLNEVYHTINILNPTTSTFDDLIRKDVRGYPPVALRESLLNAIIHRSYTIQGSNIINIYNNHIEFISQGSLVPGLSLEAIHLGISLPRNPNLAAIFYRMELIESYGTGIRKIKDSYYKQPSQPIFKTAEGVFYISLPKLCNQKNISYVREKEIVYHTNQTEIILQLLNDHDTITRKDVENALNITQTPAFNLLKKLCNQGILIQQKQGKQTVYKKSS